MPRPSTGLLSLSRDCPEQEEVRVGYLGACSLSWKCSRERLLGKLPCRPGTPILSGERGCGVVAREEPCCCLQRNTLGAYKLS